MDDLKHINRHKPCPACEKMYRMQIMQLEKQIELLTKMVEMERISKTIVMPIPEGLKVIGVK